MRGGRQLYLTQIAAQAIPNDIPPNGAGSIMLWDNIVVDEGGPFTLDEATGKVTAALDTRYNDQSSIFVGGSVLWDEGATPTGLRVWGIIHYRDDEIFRMLYMAGYMAENNLNPVAPTNSGFIPDCRVGDQFGMFACQQSGLSLNTASLVVAQTLELGLQEASSFWMIAV